jgi:hypothetical protein
MINWEGFDPAGIVYDAEADGVWIQDDKGVPTIFLYRNIIIRAVGLLPTDSPEKVHPGAQKN